jgi:hypothetical protein
MPEIKEGIEKEEGPKISITGMKPGIKSFEDYDVFGGKYEMSRDDYKESTFHNASQEDGDPTFNAKAKLLNVTGSELFEESEKKRTNVEQKEEAAIEP